MIPASKGRSDTFLDLGYKGMASDFPEMNPILSYRRKKRLMPMLEVNKWHSRREPSGRQYIQDQ
ncbi:MAG: hypothetical protein KGI33_12835, partial [Thaumarchaeota archaeon]|nr:hypothetical protein [Nitrososphaerota archaeon]